MKSYSMDTCTVIKEFSPWSVADSALLENAVEFDIPLLRNRKNSLPHEVKALIDHALDSLLIKNGLTLDKISLSSSLLYIVPYNAEKPQKLILHVYMASDELADESDDLFWEITPEDVDYSPIIRYIKSEMWKFLFP